MGTLIITREKKFVGCAKALYCFVSDWFLDENRMHVCNFLENGKSITLTFDSEVVAMKCRVGQFREVDAPVFNEIYAIEFREHSVIHAFVSFKQGITFTDEHGNKIEFKPLLKYALDCDLIEEKDPWDMSILYQSFVPTEFFAPSKEYGERLAVDEQRKKWAYFDRGITLINRPSNKIYNFSDIVSFELLENGSSVTKGGLGSAVVGGALFGSTGAVVGAMTGTKTTTGVCNSMQIAVTVKDKKTPDIYIPIVNAPVSTLSDAYIEYKKIAKDIMTVLNRMYLDGQNRTNVVKEKSNDTDDLRKYKALLDEGLITAEDYDTIKKRILKI